MGTFTLSLRDVNRFAKGDIGLNTYPIFDSAYRPGLNMKIYDHYMNQEIGMETIDMFQLAISRKMNEVMPYYNQLYFSQQIEFDPMRTIDLKTLNVGNTAASTTTNAESENNSNNTSRGRTVQSETPQTLLSEGGDYASAAADANSENVGKGVATEKGSSENAVDQSNDSSTVGYQGIPANLLMAYRGSLMNIDLSVINELQDCFHMMWGNEDYSGIGDTLRHFPQL